MNENIPLRNSNFTKKSDREILDTHQEEKDKLKATLRRINEDFIMKGEPDHIITLPEVATALGTDSQKVQTLLRKLFTSPSLNDLLNMMGLPYKIIKRL